MVWCTTSSRKWGSFAGGTDGDTDGSGDDDGEDKGFCAGVGNVNLPTEEEKDWLADLANLEIGSVIHMIYIKLEEDVVPQISDRDFTIATIAAPTVMPVEEEPETEEKEGEEDAEGAEDTETKEGEEGKEGKSEENKEETKKTESKKEEDSKK